MASEYKGFSCGEDDDWCPEARVRAGQAARLIGESCKTMPLVEKCVETHLYEMSCMYLLHYEPNEYGHTIDLFFEPTGSFWIRVGVDGWFWVYLDEAETRDACTLVRMFYGKATRFRVRYNWIARRRVLYVSDGRSHWSL